jgi:Kef-type K+ transport system membrane component KefB
MEIALFFALAYGITVLVGVPLERLKIPWIFGALLLGMGLAAWNPLQKVTSGPEFKFLSEVGMYFFLYVVGFELSLENISIDRKFKLSTATLIILAEAIPAAIFIHYIWGTRWLYAATVGFSFGTLGEAAILPVLHKFKLVKTDIGETILGVGIANMFFEILVVSVVAVLLVLYGQGGGFLDQNAHLTLGGSLGTIAALGVITFLVRRIPPGRVYEILDIFQVGRKHEVAFALSLVVFFGLLCIASFGKAGALAALLGGIAVRPIFPVHLAEGIIDDVRVVTYGVFTPLFFISAGLETDPHYLLLHIPLVLAFMANCMAGKAWVGVMQGWGKFGLKKSVFMGASWMMKFNTSIVIMKLMYDAKLIEKPLFSTLVAVKICLKFAIPVLMGWMLTRWNVGQDERGRLAQRKDQEKAERERKEGKK